MQIRTFTGDAVARTSTMSRGCASRCSALFPTSTTAMSATRRPISPPMHVRRKACSCSPSTMAAWSAPRPGCRCPDETPSFQKPFIERGFALGQVFYFGESVLLPAYRGQGLGHRFFDEREDYARRLGRFNTTAFCAVERAEDDPRRPPGTAERRVLAQARLRAPARHALRDRMEGSRRQRSNLHRLAFWLRALGRDEAHGRRRARTIAAPADYPSFAARVSAHVAAAAARGESRRPAGIPGARAAAGQPSEVRGDFVRSLAALQAPG